METLQFKLFGPPAPVDLKDLKDEAPQTTEEDSKGSSFSDKQIPLFVPVESTYCVDPQKDKVLVQIIDTEKRIRTGVHFYVAKHLVTGFQRIFSIPANLVSTVEG